MMPIVLVVMTVPVLAASDDVYGVTDSRVYRWSDAPYMDAAGADYDPRLLGDISWRREAVTGLWSRGVGRGGLGTIELANTDGALDHILGNSTRDARVAVYWLESEAEQPDDSTQVAGAWVSEIAGQGEATLKITTRDAVARLDVPLTAARYTSGPDGVVGRARPVSLGRPLSVPAVLINDVDYDYDVHDDSAFDVITVRDAGAVLTPDAGWDEFGLGFRLELAPVGAIVADVAADASVTPSLHRWDNVLQRVAARAGLAAGDIDAAGITAAAVAFDAGCSYFDAQGATAQAAAAAIADSVLAFIYGDHRGRLAARLFNPPTGEAALDLDAEVDVDGDIDCEVDAMPLIASHVGAGRNWSVYRREDLADTLSDADKVLLSSEYRFRAPIGLMGPEIVARGRGTGRALEATDVWPTLLDDSTEAAALAARIESLVPPGTVARFLKCTAFGTRAQLRTLAPGDVVRITSDRYGLSAHPTVLLGIEGRAGVLSASLWLWTTFDPNADSVTWDSTVYRWDTTTITWDAT